jgi:OmcA/MtrC family decaheme c-type cytochrome
MIVQRSNLAIVSLTLASLVSLAACSGDRGAQGNSCSVAMSDAGATITCDDGTHAVVARAAGACTIKSESDGTKKLQCDDGTSQVIADGKQGAKGSDGSPGAQGTPGAQGGQGEQGGTARSAYVVGAGLVIDVMSVTIPDDLHPIATLRLRDTAMHPLERTGVYTPGAVTVSLVLAHLASADGKVGQYVPYNTASVTGATVASVAPALASATQPRSENNGTWTELDASTGTYTYRFNQALPAEYDRTKTHTLAVYASRTYEGVAYVANPLFHFRPDAQPVTEKREVVTTAACNACHNTLRLHGGSRREVGLCITCHVDGMNDPESGNSLDLAQMIHKIHSGKDLPSVVAGGAYKIIGFNNGVNDYSTVAFPQALENCETCHQGGADSARWKTAFTRAACGSCHDATSFVNPAPSGHVLHTGGQQTTDTLCVNCHAEGMGPIATLETDVVKVHSTLDEFPLRNNSTGAVISTAPTLTGSVVSVTGTGPTDVPVVRFTVAVDGAPYDILASGKALSRLRVTFAGPTTDYAGYVQYTAQGSGAVGTLAAGSTAGEFTWTVPAAVTVTSIATACTTQPAGSFAVGLEGRLTTTASMPNGSVVMVNYSMHNAVGYFGVTDAQAVPRREAVVVANCNHCHQDLAAHGGSRNDPEYCVLCHSGNKDTTNIPAPAVGATKLTTSLRLSHMIHRIHAGENGANPFIVGANDFGEVRFPGDRQDCLNCHVKSHYTLPLPALLPSHMTMIDSTKARVASSDYYVQATTAACTGCHDSDSAVTHAVSMTTAQGKESCATCHGANKAYDIDVVHARPGL